MSKKRYNIVLTDASLQDQILADECCEMEVCDHLPMLDGVVSMMLTEEEARHLEEDCDRIISVEPELPVIEHAFSPQSMTKEMRTKYSVSTSTPGANYASTAFHFHSNQTTTANTAPIGWFDSAEDNIVPGQVITQHYAGQFVDIVAIEAGTPDALNDNHVTNPDFLDDQGSTRFVKMDWDVHNGSITSARNRQATNNTTYFSDHAIGVLSAAGGLICGWGKVASLRVIYLSDGVTTAYDAVLNWHLSKPVNPLTGRQNATITTGAWGYGGVDHTTAWRVTEIESITSYDKFGNRTDVTRPGAGWGNDLTPFVNAGMMPRVIEDPTDNTDKWYITSGVQNRATSFDTVLGNYVSNGTIYHFKSAGNNAFVAGATTDPCWNTSIRVPAGATYISISTNVLGKYVFASATLGSAYDWYPLRSYAEGGTNMITVGACQHSDLNPLPDDYSNRGQMIDVFASGAYTWTSYPSGTYTDGKWGYFSGTSCAAPVAAGNAVVMVDWFYDTYGEYPTHQQLKDLMVRTSKPIMESENLIDWSNTPAASNSISSRLYAGSEVNRIKEDDFQNGGSQLSDLGVGTSPNRVHIPNWILYNTKNSASSTNKLNYHYASLDADRQNWPRRKIRVG